MRLVTDWMDPAIEKYFVTVDSDGDIEVAPVVDSDTGQKRLDFDLDALTPGDHTIVVEADNGWERVADDPFDITRPAVIQIPFGLRLERG